MLDDQGFEIYEENPFPIAYLITFRTYGTWLPGDSRGSYKRDGGKFGVKRISPNVPLREKMAEASRTPVLLNQEQRKIVTEAIEGVCNHRSYLLRALNVRTNHVHVAVTMDLPPDRIVNDFKAYATRALRANLQFSPKIQIWARGASTRYLWKPRHVMAAVDYVLYTQEDMPFEFRD